MRWSVIASPLMMLLTACEPSNGPTSAEIRRAEQEERANRVIQERVTARLVQEKKECEPLLEGQKREYKALYSSGRYWEAGTVIRTCARATDDVDLRKLVSDAERQSYLQDLNPSLSLSPIKPN